MFLYTFSGTGLVTIVLSRILRMPLQIVHRVFIFGTGSTYLIPQFPNMNTKSLTSSLSWSNKQFLPTFEILKVLYL